LTGARRLTRCVCYQDDDAAASSGRRIDPVVGRAGQIDYDSRDKRARTVFRHADPSHQRILWRRRDWHGLAWQHISEIEIDARRTQRRSTARLRQRSARLDDDRHTIGRRYN